MMKSYMSCQLILKRFIHCKGFQVSAAKEVRALRSKKPRKLYPTDANFCDLREVRIKGGNGGDGCISFLRLWCNPNAGPDGGDGGNGGHILFKATRNCKDLHHIPSTITGNDGINGHNTDCHGRNGEHITIPVPLGTVIRSNVSESKIILEMDGQMFIAAKGGAGGKGNHFYATDSEQVPKLAEVGGEGETKIYVLEMTIIADFGLIGFPNAGKSSLLQSLTRARPKVAAYPFTTLRPHIGIIEYEDFSRLTVADIPGLIDDAHKNRGLGIRFLKHVKRCMGLIYVIDASQETCLEELESLKFELERYEKGLSLKPHLVIANKIDLPSSRDILHRLERELKSNFIPISAKYGKNTGTVVTALKELSGHLRQTPCDHKLGSTCLTLG